MPALFLSRVASSSHRTSSRASKCPKNQSHQLPPFRIWDTSAFSSMKCITLSRLFIERKFYDFPFVRMINVMTLLLEVRGLTVELPTAAGWVRPVNEASLSISAGESLGLVGESGSGKTMLSLALTGLLPPGARVSGEASLATESCPKKLTSLSEHEWRDVRGGEIAMVFQEPMTSLNPAMRIGRRFSFFCRNSS